MLGRMEVPSSDRIADKLSEALIAAWEIEAKQEATSRRCRTCSVLGDVPMPAGVPDGDPPAQARGRACGVASPTGSSIVVCRCARESGRFHVARTTALGGGAGAPRGVADVAAISA